MKLPDAIKDELGMIGHCLEFGLETALVAVEQLPVEAMLHPGCRDALKVIEELATQNHEVNPYTVSLKWKERFGALPPAEILDSVREAVTPSTIHYNIEAIVAAWKKRRIMEACSRILERAEQLNADDLLTEAEKMLRTEERIGGNVLTGKEIGQCLCEDLERRHQLNGGLSGVSTPFGHLNELTEGLQYGEQTIIGARPSQGKTSLGLNFCAHACFNFQIPTMFVSIEMGAVHIAHRMLSAWSTMSLQAIRRGTYQEKDFKTFTTFFAFIKKHPFFHYDAVGGVGINQLCAVVRRYCQRQGVKLVVIDYLQKIRSEYKQEKKTYEIGEVSSALKALATQTGVAMVTLAQLNRESEKGNQRGPRLADLADSKSIENDADTVMLLYREDRTNEPEKTALIISKQRNGALGTVNLHFNGKLARFENPP